MSNGLPTRFVMKIGQKPSVYHVRCTLKRPAWVNPEGRDCSGMTRFAPKDIWVFRFKNVFSQLEILAHEVGHAVIYEYGLERELGKLEEAVVSELIQKTLYSLWRLGGRWPVWEIRAMGGVITIKNMPKGIEG